MFFYSQPYYNFILVIMACISHFPTLAEYQPKVYSTLLKLLLKRGRRDDLLR
jgi:hypothetical protein